MILYKKDDFIYYEDTLDKFYDNNLKIAFDDVGSNNILITIHRNSGQDYDNILTRRFPATAINDRLGDAYGSTLEDVIFGFNEGTDVNVEDQITPPIENFLYLELNSVTITGTPAKGTNVLTLSAGHNFIDPVGFERDYLNIHYVDESLPGKSGLRFNQFAVIDVTGNDITINPKLPYDLSPAKVETSMRVTVNMNLLGTVADPIKFETRPPNGQVWHITRILPDMILTTLGDDGKFGNIAGGLANGEYLGVEGDNRTDYHVALFDNGDLRSTAFDLIYVLRSGGTGDFGIGTRKTYAGPMKSGVAIDLNGSVNDKFVKYTQDDLTSLLRYRIKIDGHIVKP